ncbi:MAG: hypothetical protein MUP98_14105, partial [Candidatus Aminicenantes bacterium]|nr:hypothetical protein [Candidatus Aminicenantes bacterium]
SSRGFFLKFFSPALELRTVHEACIQTHLFPHLPLMKHPTTILAFIDSKLLIGVGLVYHTGSGCQAPAPLINDPIPFKWSKMSSSPGHQVFYFR